MTGRRVACRLLLLLLLPEDHGVRRAVPSQGAGETMGRGERGLRGEEGCHQPARRRRGIASPAGG